MTWLLVGIAVVVVGLVGLVSLNSRRFAARAAAEVRRLWANVPEAKPIDKARLVSLPPPARAYLFKALGKRPAGFRALRFRHTGQFRAKLDGPWQRIRGEQYEAMDPPGFVWWGRLRAAPGLWVDALDRSVNGVGGMRVSLESTVTLFDRTGPEIDQGSLLRLLSDFVLFPAVLLDERYVTWAPVDEKRARVTLRLNGREVTGTFEFGEDGFPRSFHAQRFYDDGKAKPELRPWGGDYLDYREVGGVPVPFHFVGYWIVSGERKPYVDFWLDPPEVDVAEPY